MRFEFDGFDDAEWTSLSRQGDTERWESRWSVKTVSSASDVLARVDAAIERSRAGASPSPKTVQWVRVKDTTPAAAGRATRLWTFQDESGRPWSGRAVVEPLAGDKTRYQITLSVALVAAP